MAELHTHSHTHSHAHSHTHSHGSRSGNIAVAFALNFGFAILEFFGGLYTNSTAILSDALHDLGDSVSLGVSWYFERISRRGATKRFSYGLKRFSLIGAIINSLVLLAGSIIILFEVIPRLIDPQPTNATGMLIFAIFGIAVNGAAMLRLRSGNSLNERVVSLHLLEDVLGWVAVLVGSIIMMWWDVPILDPIMSLAITAFILFNVVRNIRSIVVVILQGIPEGVEADEVASTISQNEGVAAVHDLHVWSMDTDDNILSAHIIIKDGADPAAIKESLREVLHEKFEITHATLEIEATDEQCTADRCNTVVDGEVVYPNNR